MMKRAEARELSSTFAEIEAQAQRQDVRQKKVLEEGEKLKQPEKKKEEPEGHKLARKVFWMEAGAVKPLLWQEITKSQQGQRENGAV